MRFWLSLIWGSLEEHEETNKGKVEFVLGIGSAHYGWARFERHCNQCLDTIDWVLSIFLRVLTLGGNWDLHNVVRFVVGCQSHRCTLVVVLGILFRVVIKKHFFWDSFNVWRLLLIIALYHQTNAPIGF